MHRESPFRHLRAGPAPGATGRTAQFPTYFGVQPALLKPPTPAVTRGPDRPNEISRNSVLPTSALVQRRHQLWAFRSDLPRSVATRQGGPSRASNAGRLGLGPSPPTRTRRPRTSSRPFPAWSRLRHPPSRHVNAPTPYDPARMPGLRRIRRLPRSVPLRVLPVRHSSIRRHQIMDCCCRAVSTSVTMVIVTPSPSAGRITELQRY